MPSYERNVYLMRSYSPAKTAQKIRELCLEMIYRSQSSHLGTNLSIADILAVLYGRILRIKPKEPTWRNRDRFILSKGHGAAALYAVLALHGFFPLRWLETYCKNGGKLAGHSTRDGIPGVEVSTGSLGHGLSLGCGMALAAKRDRKSYRVFVLLSDGELDEGSTWESILFASHHKLDNLIAIVDYNKIQSLTWVKDTLALEPLVEKWRAFHWAVREVDGHNVFELEQCLKDIPFQKGKPNCLVAHTVKGKGIRFMENNNLWHYRAPNEEEFRQALKELETQVL